MATAALLELRSSGCQFLPQSRVFGNFRVEISRLQVSKRLCRLGADAVFPVGDDEPEEGGDDDDFDG